MSVGSRVARLAVVLALVAAAGACGSTEHDSSDDGRVLPTRLIKADVDRAPAADGADLVPAVVDADSQFGLQLLARLTSEDDGNVFISPYSIATALAMTYAGARGGTAAELARVLGITGLGQRAHEGRNSLDLKLLAPRTNAFALPGEPAPEGKPLSLTISNSLWGQAGIDFLRPFLEQLARNYAAGMNTVDFQRAAEDARVTINHWVADHTDGRIKELLIPGVLVQLTRLVLVNTITFEASWQRPFDATLTKPAPFTRADGSTAAVPMMHRELRTEYRHVAGWQYVRVPYIGDASAIFLLPDDPNAVLDASAWNAISAGRGDAIVTLSLPKFSYTSRASLAAPLQAMGVSLPFDPDRADFSGMDGRHDLFVSAVEHQAYVDVDEKGTRAGASTAVVMEATSAPPRVTVAFDRPFTFVIQDDETGELLFAGRVADPRE
jgi:serpin B